MAQTLKQAHEQTKEEAASDAASANPLRPNDHESRRTQKLREKHPADVRLHFVFRSPNGFGGVVIRLQPEAMDEKIGREDHNPTGDNGENQTFHIHDPD